MPYMSFPRMIMTAHITNGWMIHCPEVFLIGLPFRMPLLLNELAANEH